MLADMYEQRQNISLSYTKHERWAGDASSAMSL